MAELGKYPSSAAHSGNDIQSGKNSAHPDLPCLGRHYNPMNSSLCKKRKRDIIANCGDETNLLIELLAVMAEN
jgi:hypothetical protein